MHEIFINESRKSNSKTLLDGNLNIHSIGNIEREFGKDFKITFERTYYKNWEKRDRISAFVCIRRI